MSGLAGPGEGRAAGGRGAIFYGRDSGHEPRISLFPLTPPLEVTPGSGTHRSRAGVTDTAVTAPGPKPPWLRTRSENVP